MKHDNLTYVHRSAIATVFAFLTIMFNPAMAADRQEAGDFANGSRLWAENCNRCHNIRGPKELRDDQWISTVFHMRLRAGLTGQEARDILTFLQASNSPVVIPKSSSVPSTNIDDDTSDSGKETFNQTCMACHGLDGKGAFPGVPDFTSPSGPLSKPDQTLITHITEGFQSPGSAMAMPPKGGNAKLTQPEILSVLKYLKETFKP